MSDPGSAVPPANGADAQPARSAGRGANAIRRAVPVLEDLVSGLWSFLQRYVVPPLKKLGTVLGDWLATVGWGKFVLLSLLALAIAGIVNGIMHEQAAVVVERAVPHDDVKVDVKITDEGIRISPSVPKRHRPLPSGRSPRSTVSAESAGTSRAASRCGRVQAKGRSANRRERNSHQFRS